jgi:predicted RNase H-like nuclease
MAADIGQARAWNLEEVGRSLSAQAWGICKKIAEVDHILLTDREARQRVMEVHPEICFWALNGGTPMRHRKRKAAGVQERLATLRTWEPDSAELLAKVLHEQLRADVTSDDVLDAIVALVTADAEGDQFGTLPQTPGADDQGLPMQMVYRNPRAAEEPARGIRVQGSTARPSSRREGDYQSREDS